MRDHWPKLVIVALLLAVVGVPFLLRPAAEEAEGSRTAEQASGGKLIIITPHNEQIRAELARGFNAWRVRQNLPPVEFDWRASGGTTDLRKGILAQYQAKAERGRADDGIGADLFFGGGEYDHNKVAQGVKVGGETVMIAVPAPLPKGLFEVVYPRADIGGERLYHKDRLWLGTALSSFGIVYNRDLLLMLGLDAPTTWSDLTDPAYFNWVAMADPGHSGSIAATLSTVISRLGWAEGWHVLRRVFANSRYFASGANKVPVDVSSGDAAAGMCIDFYGRFQAGAVQSAGWSGDTQHNGLSRVGYSDPVVDGKSMTATTADPITLLRGAPNRGAAEQFIAWVLTKPAQRLWQLELGSEAGPARFELRRMPVREDLYTDAEKAQWADPEIDPFATATPLPKGVPNFFGMVSPVSHALAIDVHHDLQEAWQAILRTPDDHPDKAKMLELFDAMPAELTIHWPTEAMAMDWQSILADADHPQHDEVAAVLEGFAEGLDARSDDQKLKDQLRWTLFFRENYRQVAAMGG